MVYILLSIDRMYLYCNIRGMERDENNNQVLAQKKRKKRKQIKKHSEKWKSNHFRNFHDLALQMNG